MDYLTDIKLPLTDVGKWRDLYPDREKHDIHSAVYHETIETDSNPDLCALPLEIPPKELFLLNTAAFPGYSHEKVENMRLSDRYDCLAAFKDKVRIYLPYHSELERRFNHCLASSYRTRSYGILPGSCAVLSTTAPINSSVQNMSLVGTAGTGKSTAINLMLSRIPKGIRHKLPNGFMYTQIPVLSTTANQWNDVKSIFINLAKSVDQIMGIPECYYEKQMQRQSTIAKMTSFFGSLVQLFHIGMIAIDEIQLAAGKNMFTTLLTVTATYGVSLLIAGTEDAIYHLNKSEWFARRFSQLGRVTSDLLTADELYLEGAIKQLWTCQWTKDLYPLTDNVIRALKEESGGNLDYLSTIMVTAQKLVIASEIEAKRTGNKSRIMRLDEKAIVTAAKMYPNARQYILEGKTNVEAYYLNEKNAALKAIRDDADDARKRESVAIMRSAADVFTRQAAVLEDVTNRIRAIYDDIDYKTVELTFKRLASTKDSFLDLDRKQQTKLVLLEITKAMDEKKRKTDSKKTIFENEIQTINNRIAHPEDGDVSELLQATVS